MNKVTVGIGTIVGYTLTTLAAAGTAWATAEGASSHIAPGLLAVITVVAGTLTSLGRMYQGGKAIEATNQPLVLPLPPGPSSAAGEVQRPESALTPDGAQTAEVPATAAPGAGG